MHTLAEGRALSEITRPGDAKPKLLKQSVCTSVCHILRRGNQKEEAVLVVKQNKVATSSFMMRASV
jgi:hypothetical protein